MDRSEKSVPKPPKCTALADSIMNSVRDTWQFCTPGHRSGKAFLLLLTALNRSATVGPTLMK